ncbi:MAG TPA: uroporphyrinogen decarboxylase family protein [Anaerolineae bacterium]|nr:uroporphyrinogen decarboxylase family protein [Anaerolineae bacterium]HOR00537.1 uroporphyrinogen decarboxylase family protein [Anaerolineae bacterium]HPL29935.1 uroporphyrinogen decarboxylase family protein [Anaerolineae bacterium]
MLTMVKALVKGKLRLGKLSGIERFMLAQIGLPDRVPTMLAATNIEPYMLDPKYNWRSTVESIEANIALADRVCELFDCDMVSVPIWQGTMGMGAADLGTEYKISEDRVPYPVAYPLQRKEDIARITLPEEATGYLKMYFDICAEFQRRHPELLLPLTLDGPWDLAMLLRGDDKLPMDMRLHKDYVETDDPVRKEKIRRRGDPDIYPAIMELTSQLASRHFDLAVKYGMSLTGASLVDQYAASPILSRQDYVKYALPYIERVWLHHKKKLTIVAPCTSPMEMRRILETEPAGIRHQILWANYVFPTTPEGITLPEYDRPAFELAKEYKRSFAYIVHGKFLRDASGQEIEALVKRVCTSATEMRTSISLSISSVPPGTDLQKINLTFDFVKKYGRY